MIQQVVETSDRKNGALQRRAADPSGWCFPAKKLAIALHLAG
jgi:hypothetical protein